MRQGWSFLPTPGDLNALAPGLDGNFERLGSRNTAATIIHRNARVQEYDRAEDLNSNMLVHFNDQGVYLY